MIVYRASEAYCCVYFGSRGQWASWRRVIFAKICDSGPATLYRQHLLLGMSRLPSTASADREAAALASVNAEPQLPALDPKPRSFRGPAFSASNSLSRPQNITNIPRSPKCKNPELDSKTNGRNKKHLEHTMMTPKTYFRPGRPQGP